MVEKAGGSQSQSIGLVSRTAGTLGQLTGQRDGKGEGLIGEPHSHHGESKGNWDYIRS